MHPPRLRTLIAASLTVLLLAAPVAAGAGPLEDADPSLTTTTDDTANTAGGWEARADELPGHDIADGKAQELAGEELSVDDALTRRLSDLPCEDGAAGPFPCDNVDLLSFVSNAELGGVNGNDLWGWTDPADGSEYVIMGTGYTTAFVDISEPTDPVVVAVLPTESGQYLPLWRDVKVYDNHAFIVSEHTGHGMQVVDLTRLRDAGPEETVLLPDATYSDFSWAHNIAINEDTGYAYAVGTNTCSGGLHMVDINKPTEPAFAGCFGGQDEDGNETGDGYTHDVQCVTYDGPDGRYRGNEICFASNEDTVTIVDVTDKENPVMLSRTGYDTAAYTHQGWLTPDHRWFLFGDELDEQRDESVTHTTTYLMDVAKLGDPGTPTPYAHDTESIDHNLYIDGQFVYQANYTAGLRVLTYDKHGLRDGRLDEVGFFDVAPEVDVAEFAGAWSNYPFFDSGVVAVSTIEGGLFLLDVDLPEDSGPGRGPKPR